MQNWVAISLLAGLADIAFNFVSRKYLKLNGNPLNFSWWFSLIRTFLFGLFSIAHINNLNLTDNLLFTLVIIGTLNTLNIYFFMQMHSITQLSLSSIIVQLRIVWVPVFAILLIGERLSIGEYAGIAFLLIAVLSIRSAKKLILDKSVNAAFIFSLTTSILTVLLKKVSSQVPIETIIFFMSLPAVFILPFFIKEKRALLSTWKEDFSKKLIVVFFSILTLYSSIAALASGGPVSSVNALTQIISVFSGAFGIVILKEREELSKKVLSIMLAVVGILLLV